jgi:putative OPT family oligopeptide transporter
MVAVATGVLGGELPWEMIAIGAGIGVAIIAMDEWLRRRASDFRMPVLAVAIGIYLPIELAIPIAIGGLIAWLVKTKSVAGVLAAAGLITGEALTGILIAIPIVITGDPAVLAISDEPYGMLAGLMLILIISTGLLRIARADSKTT